MFKSELFDVEDIPCPFCDKPALTKAAEQKARTVYENLLRVLDHNNYYFFNPEFDKKMLKK